MQNHTRAVFFDAGNTILEPKHSPALVYARTFRKWGLSVDNEDVEQSFKETWLQVNRDYMLGDDKFSTYQGGEEAFWRDFVSRVMKPHGHVSDFDSCFEELYQIFRQPGTWKLYSDVIPVLESLRQKHYSIGIISNWDSSLKPILKALNVTEYMDTVIISGLAGVAKPDSGIFKLASQTIGVSREYCLHIGDSLRDDYLGAQNAGFQALLMDRTRQHNGNVRCIHTATELFRWLN